MMNSVVRNKIINATNNKTENSESVTNNLFLKQFIQNQYKHSYILRNKT